MSTYLEQRNESIGEDLILETLKEIKARIERTTIDFVADTSRPVWRFSDWGACTCGHIYAVASKNDGKRGSVTQPRTVDGLYEETLKAIGRANPEAIGAYYRNNLELPGDYLAYAVSNATTRVGLELAGYEVGDSEPTDSALIDYEKEDEYEENQRRAALTLVDNTIKAIEQGYEDARNEIANGGKQ